MEIIVPSGVCGGQKLVVKSPQGQMLQVVVPMGLQPGQRFRIACGPTPAPQAVNQFQQQQMMMQQQQQQQQMMAQQEAQRQQRIQQQRLAAMQRAAPKTTQQFAFKIPAGVRPGNKITINLPDGRQVQVTVVSGLPTVHFQFLLLVFFNFFCLCFCFFYFFHLDNNDDTFLPLCDIHTTQPAGMGPGNTMTVKYESSAPQQSQTQANTQAGTSKVKVVVPQGAVPGTKIRVSFQGYDYDVAVPQGVPPGSKFIAVLPTALAMQQKQMYNRMKTDEARLNQERSMLSAEKQQRANQMIEQSMAKQEEARAVFQKYDVNHDNGIDPAELLRLLQDSGFPQSVIEEELRTADMDGDNNISFDEFVVYYNHLQERIKMGAATTAQQQEQMQIQMQEMKNALLIQQQMLKQKELEMAERNMALAKKEADLARAEVEAHTGVHNDDIISVDARVADLMQANDIAAAQYAQSIQNQQQNRQVRLRQQLAAKKAAKKARNCPHANDQMNMAKRGSALGNAGAQVVVAQMI